VHTCALNSAGIVKCWGGNTELFLNPFPVGQLGDGTYSDRSTPVDVVDLPATTVAISAGAWSSCAVSQSGMVKCWGTGFGNRAVDAPGLTSGIALVTTNGGALRVSLSAPPQPYSHTCGLTTGGGVKCQGNNMFGELGNGGTSSESSAVDVIGLASGVTAVSAGGAHICALTGTGRVRCWGRNAVGQLGDATLSESAPYTPPGDVLGLPSGIHQITAGGNHSCARTSTGGAKCWGANAIRFFNGAGFATGAVGDGTFTDRRSAVDVIGLTSGVADISAGGFHTCAVTTSGAARCWGSNIFGEIGDGSKTLRNSPVSVSGLEAGVAAITAGQVHTCAKTATGFAKCWGANTYGALGDGTRTERLTPTDVPGLGAINQISAGAEHTCAVTIDGAVRCWGTNAAGQLGDGTTTDKYVPTPVSGLRGTVTAIATGYWHSCALASTGSVRCWGANDRGQLGDNTKQNRSLPVEVVGLSSGGPFAVAISAGDFHTCARMSNGDMFCWGANDVGQIDAFATDRLVPSAIHGGFPRMNASSIAAGGDHTCAVVDEGRTAKCWGSNPYGQLGNGRVNVSGIRTFPAPVVISPKARLSNISTRATVLPGDGALIGGFIIGGTSSKRVVVSVAGPSLASAGITATLANPKLTLVRSSDNTIVGANDDWRAQADPADVAAIEASGFQPGNALEPALLATLPPGAYTVIVQGVGETTGVALVGLFEVDQPLAPLINISTRGTVRSGEEVMIAGFIIGGDSPRTVVVNVAGPSLGVGGPLLDPQLTLVRSSDNAVIAYNNNWQQQANPADAAAIQATGFQPHNAFEPALIATLPPGAYTAIVTGVAGGTGVALVGVFSTP
jgi:alpha-tubulin suppressor-like RCC1 family protein